MQARIFQHSGESVEPLTFSLLHPLRSLPAAPGAQIPHFAKHGHVMLQGPFTHGFAGIE